MKYLINVFSNIVKVSSGFIFFLLLTKYNSAEQLGQLGQLLTFSAATMMMGTLGIQNKLIQDFSINSNEMDINYLISITIISFVFLLIVLIIGKVFFFELSVLYGGTSTKYFYIFIFFIFIMAIYIQFKIAMHSGKGNYKDLAKINIYGSLVALLSAYVFLDIFNGTNHQFFLIMLYPCFKIAFMMKLKGDFTVISHCFYTRLQEQLILKHLKAMLPFVVMASFSVVTIYGFQYSVRDLIGNNLDWGYVGQWQILQKHSEVVSLLFFSIAGVFIIPKIAGQNESIQLGISKTYAIGFLFAGVVGLFLVKIIGTIYIDFLFGHEYELAGELLFVQLIGDLCKVIAYCFALNVLCNSWVKVYVLFEITQYSLLYASYYACLQLFDGTYIAHAYSIAYLIYMVFSISFLICYMKSKIHTQRDNSTDGNKVES